MSSTLIRKQTYRRTLQHKFDFTFNDKSRFNLSTKSKILAQKSRNTFVSINPTIFIFKLKVYFFWTSNSNENKTNIFTQFEVRTFEINQFHGSLNPN